MVTEAPIKATISRLRLRSKDRGGKCHHQKQKGDPPLCWGRRAHSFIVNNNDFGW